MPPSRWHFWQLAWKIRAISLLKVTPVWPSGSRAGSVLGVRATPIPAGSACPSRTTAPASAAPPARTAAATRSVGLARMSVYVTALPPPSNRSLWGKGRSHEASVTTLAAREAPEVTEGGVARRGSVARGRDQASGRRPHPAEPLAGAPKAQVPPAARSDGGSRPQCEATETGGREGSQDWRGVRRQGVGTPV